MTRSPDDRDISIQPRPGALPPSVPAAPQSAPAPPVAPSVPAGRRWLVLIAIDRYANPYFLSGLKCCVADAEALRNILYARYGFLPQHTLEIYNEEATERAIRRAFEGRLLDLIASDDDVVIAFSGHGYYDPRSQLGRWYPHDAEEVSDGILNSAVRDWCKALPARHVLVVSDSCFSGSLLIRAQAVGDPSLRSRELIASGGLHPVADSGSPDGCHSVFNYYLCRGLERLAGRGQPFGTNQLYVALYDPVRTNAEQEPQHGIIHGARHEGGQFVFEPARAVEFDEAPLAPPRLLEVPDFVTEDIERIEQRRREQETQRREAEEQSLREFVAAAEKAFQVLENKDDSPYIDAGTKAAKWREFLDAFGGKDREADHRLTQRFQRARERVAHWEEEMETATRRRREEEQRQKAREDKIHKADEETPPTKTFDLSRPKTGTVMTLDLGRIEVRSGFLGTKKRLEPVTMNLVYIRGGTFTMGSPESEKERLEKEGPQTRVTLTNDFWIGETPVTQAQWKAVMGSGNNPSHFTGDNLPVKKVSWNDAMEFCKKLTEKVAQASPPASSNSSARRDAGATFTLPTEAQWEYACRAGTTTRFSFGDSDSSLGDYAWYHKNSGLKTHPVKTKKPNAWGLYDMHGNVWEWCLDWFDYYPGGSVTNPNSPPFGSSRVLRGGCWDRAPGNCRSATRLGLEPGYRSNVLGFRAVAAVQ